MNSTNTTGASNSTESSTAEVRFLNIRLLDPTDALATWAPPNGTSSMNYTSEISYDRKTWKRLKLENPTSTFAQFMITEQTSFEVRVTPQGGAPSMAEWSPKKNAGKATGKAMSNNGKATNGKQ